MSPEELVRIFQPPLAEEMIRSNVVPPPKYPVAIAGSAVQQSLIAQSPILGWADGQSAAKTQVLEATLLLPAGLPKALEASPIVLGTLGFPSSGDRIRDVPTKAKLSATVNCRVK